MKKSKLNSLVVYLCGVLICLWLITPMMAVTPEEGSGDIDQWMNSLPEKTRASVLEVFANVVCVGNTGLKGEQSLSTADQIAERIYRDLQIILTEEQLDAFCRLTKRSDKAPEMDISVTLSTCSACSVVYTSLRDKVVPYLGTAISKYDFASYCEYPPWGMPDSIGLMMSLAKSAAQRARDKASAAYNSCDCTSAQGALTDAQQSLYYLNLAISGTKSRCEPDAPWLEWLEAAKDWLEYVISKLPACISQACS
jgi:hypothetical protein